MRLPKGFGGVSGKKASVLELSRPSASAQTPAPAMSLRESSGVTILQPQRCPGAHVRLEALSTQKQKQKRKEKRTKA